MQTKVGTSFTESPESNETVEVRNFHLDVFHNNELFKVLNCDRYQFFGNPKKKTFFFTVTDIKV
jgi:hypothetical protein